MTTTPRKCDKCGQSFDSIPLYCYNCYAHIGGQPDLEVFLELEANGLISNGLIDEVGDYIFDEINTMCCNGEFEKIDRILSNVCVRNMHTQTIISLLSITLAAKDKLKARKQFYFDAQGILSEKETPRRVQRLLSGLE